MTTCTELIEQGLFTYESEGNDSGRWNSRVLHWPESASGVTIGRGYDLKERRREAVVQDLIGVGVSRERAEIIAGGVSKRGTAARQFVNDNREQVGEITVCQQINLFKRVYSTYEREAKRVYSRHASSEQGYVAWENLSQPMRDIVTDMVYQGAGRISTYKAAARNSEAELIRHVEERITSETDEGKINRYEKRIDYLRRRGHN